MAAWNARRSDAIFDANFGRLYCSADTRKVLDMAQKARYIGGNSQKFFYLNVTD
jgi:hypothetical protein